MLDNAEVVRRLYTDFGPHLPYDVVAEVVSHAISDLEGNPSLAMPELVERLARHRLAFLASTLAWTA